MARRASHCLYHLGTLRNFPNVKINLHKSSVLPDANTYYRGGGIDLSRVFFKNTISLYCNACIHLLSRRPTLLIGVHLWQASLLIPLLAYNGTVVIHLHGQAHALRKKGAKYYIWLAISHFATLQVSNPAWQGPIFVQKINNINVLGNPTSAKEENKKVIYYTATGKIPKNITELDERMRLNDLEFEYVLQGINYLQLNDLLSNANYMYFESNDDYYYFSPSGRISDALNYGITLVLLQEDTVSIAVARYYCAEFITI